MWSGAATAIVIASEKVCKPEPVVNLIRTLPARLKLMLVKVATPVVESVFAAVAVTPAPVKSVRASASTRRGVIATDELTALPQAS